MDKIKWKNAQVAVEEITEVLKTQPPELCYPQAKLALEQYPQTAELHSIAGVCFLLQKDLENALGYFAHATKLAPTNLRYLVNYAALLSQLERKDEAIKIFQDVLNQDPRYESAYIGLGNIHQEEGKMELAAAEFARAVRFNPQSIAARNNYAIALVKLENYEEALEETKRILKGQPDHNTSHRRLAKLLAHFFRFDEAIPYLEQALKLYPDDAFLLHEIGKAYGHCNDPALALKYLEKAHRILPEHRHIALNLSKALHDAGLVEEAVDKLTTIAHANLSDHDLWSNLLMLHHYTDKISREQRFILHQTWAHHIEALTCPTNLAPLQESDRNRPLRIGLVSADLRKHPVGYFLLRLIENLPADFSLYGYHNTPSYDELTKTFEASCAGWHEITNLSDPEVVDRIQKDKIDILLDLSGHTSGNRLTLFAHKPAPLQVTGLGYVDTTGLSRMDYIISDGYQSPSDEDHLFTEKVWRMPGDYIVYAPPKNAPDVASLPALTNGYITFGSCNKPAKLGDATIALWSKTLNALPTSKLILRNIGLDQGEIQSHLAKKFRHHGVERNRITFLGEAKHFELLATYNQFDIGLDPTPYSGGLTTLEALWMGVPVITRGGINFASRHSITHLTNAGLPNWVTNNDDAFIELAVYWSKHLDELQALRQNLRKQLSLSRACDGQAYAQDFADFARQIWHKHVDEILS
jgi:protein O-GlcNAc transferase